MMPNVDPRNNGRNSGSHGSNTGNELPGARDARHLADEHARHVRDRVVLPMSEAAYANA